MNNLSQKSIAGRVYLEILKKDLYKKGDRVAVALSGGPDSICLTELLIDLSGKLGISILACHYNHRLRGEESDKDEKFVLDFCRKRGIECHVGRAPQKNLYKNEEQAREARYLFFKKILKEGRADKIALAHHLNDFAETILLRLIRGTGIRGVRSIPALRELFTRPLLQISRREIEEYLAKNKLKYRSDLSNFDTDIPRNQIRHEIIPVLAKLNPNIIEALGNFGLVSFDDYDFLELSAEKEFKKLLISESDQDLSLSYKDWCDLHHSLQRMVLRIGIKQLVGLNDVTFKQLEEVIDVLNNGEGKKFKSLPHSLYIELRSGKIVMFKKS